VERQGHADHGGKASLAGFSEAGYSLLSDLVLVNLGTVAYHSSFANLSLGVGRERVQ
jgi:hypothetical protein